MNHLGRSPKFFWIGYLIWTLLMPLLLFQLSRALPFLTWSDEDGGITWFYIYCAWVLFLAWPVAFRPTQVNRFWVGYLIWTPLIPWLLLKFPKGLPFVTWSNEGGDIVVTWSYIICAWVLFLAWPVAFRTTGVKDRLVKMGRGIAAGPPMLWAGMRRSPLFFVSWGVLLAAWQMASYIAPPGILEHPLVPGWDYVFGETLWRMNGDWTVIGFDFGFVNFQVHELAPYPAYGGEGTWPAVFLAVIFHSGMTLFRLLCGMALGFSLGLTTGLAIPYWSWLRQTWWAPLNFLRMIPLLAAIPWLQFALGSTLTSITLYIAFGVWTTLVVATMNAVANVPDRYIESARTLGASRPRTYFRVIVPGTIPELRTAMLLSMGGSWSLAIAAEFLGFPTGLGYMAAVAVQETNTARLVIVGFIVAIYSLTTFYLLNEGFKKAVSWMPQRVTKGTDIAKVAGAAGTGGRVESLDDS